MTLRDFVTGAAAVAVVLAVLFLLQLIAGHAAQTMTETDQRLADLERRNRPRL